MANAFNDPYWQAAVEDEVDSFPHLAGFIEDTCTTCHAPMGRTHAYRYSIWTLTELFPIRYRQK